MENGTKPDIHPLRGGQESRPNKLVTVSVDKRLEQVLLWPFDCGSRMDRGAGQSISDSRWGRIFWGDSASYQDDRCSDEMWGWMVAQFERRLLAGARGVVGGRP